MNKNIHNVKENAVISFGKYVPMNKFACNALIETLKEKQYEAALKQAWRNDIILLLFCTIRSSG